MFYQECSKKWRTELDEELINRFFMKFTYCSSKIENYEITYRDVEAIFNEKNVIDFIGNKNIIKEIENHKQLFINLFQLVKENDTKLSINKIKYCYFSLVKGCFDDKLIIKDENLRKLEREDYVSGKYNISINLFDIEGKLGNLINEINDMQINDDNALQVASYFICSFEQSKTFKCWNGQIGRILLNYVLIRNNLAPIIIFESDKKEYYSSLEYYYKKQDISRMINFLDKQAYKTWIKNYNVRAKKLKEFLDKFIIQFSILLYIK